MKRHLKIIRLGWILALILLMAWLLIQAIVPGGKITYETNFKKPNYVIGRFLPADRVVSSDGFPSLKAEPVYFTLFTPRLFSQAVITFDFEGPVELIKLGVCRDKSLWNYELKALDKQPLEKLANGDLRARLEFDLSGACRDKSSYSFMISAPGLNNSNNELIIKNIKVDLVGVTFWQYVLKFFKI